jgi:hypothetical protein
LVFVAVALVSCGGGDDQGNVENLLDRAFRQPIESADLKLDARLQLKGTEALDVPLRIEASGPFRTNEGKLPSVDLALRVGTDGGGQTVQTGFLSTGDRAFVKFEDVYYEQPAAQVRATNRAIRKAGGQGWLRSLGLNPRTWLTDGEQEGDERVAGVETTHLSGKLDVANLMSNVNVFVQRAAAALSGTGGQPTAKPLSKTDIDQLSEVVKDPEIDVYVSKKDDTLRKLSGHVEFGVPKESRPSVGGIEGGSLDFSVELANVNADQVIEAPTSARPLAELTGSLGGSLLGGAGDQPSGGGGSGGVAPVSPNGSSTSQSAPSADDFKAYADCLDKARPEDTDALQRCAELLNR